MFAIEIWPKFRYKIVEAYFGVKKKVWKTIKGHKTLSTPASTMCNHEGMGKED